MEKNLFFITFFLLFTFISCKNNEVRTNDSDSVMYIANKYISETNSTNMYMQQAVETDSDNDVSEKYGYPEEYEDDISRDCWIAIIKGAMALDKDSNSVMDVDSLIKIYADNEIPADSIRKWWNEIP